jgi:hypothetical protein
LLLVVLALGAAALYAFGRRAFSLDYWLLLDCLKESTPTRVMVWPFNPPLIAYTCEHLSPTLANGTLLGMADLAASFLWISSSHALSDFSIRVGERTD